MSGLFASVVIPSYRSAATVRACVRSVLAQDVGEPFEIVFVDSSDDDTPTIVRSEFPTVRLIARALRTEAPVARNLGLQAARAERLAFIDSDCVAPPDWLRRICAVLDDGYDGVGGAIANGNGETLVSWAGYICEFREFLPGPARRKAEYMTPNNVAYRRAALVAAGGFPPGWFPLEDQVLGRAFRERHARLCIDHSIVVAHTHRTELRAFLEHQRVFGECNARLLVAQSRPGSFLARRRWQALLGAPALVALKFVRTLHACRGVEGGLWLRRPRLAWLCWRGTCHWGRGFVRGAGSPLPPAASRSSEPAPGLSPEEGVSVVVATLDRPTHLRECLGGLRRQATARPLEIVVVDNNPASGLTPPVVAEFPGVRLVAERRRGLSYARNAGVLACRNEIIATVDDDVSFPPLWLEALVAPFARAEVGIVTGPILPLSLDTPAQRAFEVRGTLAGEGEALRVDRAWFDSFRLRAVPTWKLGTGANVAFRRRLFADPEIGLFDERLGVGTPCGAAEESYLFYRALKGKEVLCFEPRAVVRHHHHATMAAVRRRVYDYSKGHVAYHLSTLLRDRDLRAIPQLLLGQPLDLARRFVGQTWRDGTYPASLVAFELLGYLAGPAEFLRSSWRVRRVGRSERTGRLPATLPRGIGDPEPAPDRAPGAEAAPGASARA